MRNDCLRPALSLLALTGRQRWRATAPKERKWPALRHDRRTLVVVAGGGFYIYQSNQPKPAPEAAQAAPAPAPTPPARRRRSRPPPGPRRRPRRPVRRPASSPRPALRLRMPGAWQRGATSAKQNSPAERRRDHPRLCRNGRGAPRNRRHAHNAGPARPSRQSAAAAARRRAGSDCTPRLWRSRSGAR